MLSRLPPWAPVAIACFVALLLLVSFGHFTLLGLPCHEARLLLRFKAFPGFGGCATGEAPAQRRGLTDVSTTGARPRWLRLLGTSSAEVAFGVGVADDGSVYVGGSTGGGLGGETPAGGRQDGFIAKYSTDGEQQWVRLIGSTGLDQVRGIAVSAQGVVYATGSTTKGLNNIASRGLLDSFLAKYMANGDRAWLIMLGSSQDDEAKGVALAPDGGSVVVVGITKGDFEGTANAGQWDGFISKYDTAGRLLWVKLLQTEKIDTIGAVAIDSQGDIIVVGASQGNLNRNRYTIVGDAFVAKFSPEGELKWLYALGTDGNDWASCVAIGDDDSIYVSGETDGNLGGQSYAGGNDAFLAKFDADGIFVWARLLGTPGHDQALGVTGAFGGGAYVVGSLRGDAGGISNMSIQGRDAFVAKYTDDGRQVWSWLLQTRAHESAYRVARWGQGTVAIVGDTAASDLVGQQGSGDSDIFMLSLSDATAFD